MLFKYKIKPVSPIMTPLMSDTFFGHFCWAMRYKKGEKFLEDFLALYSEKNHPPVIFSSAFIAGYLPRPVLPSLKRRQTAEFVEKYFINDPDGLFSDHLASQTKRKFEGLSLIKKWNKQKFISIDEWTALKDAYSEYRLYEKFYEKLKNCLKNNSVCNQDHDPEAMVTEITTANTIDRVTGTVPEEGGGLFSREKIWFRHSTELDLYVEINSNEFSSLIKWFLTDYLPESGFGKDKSVGMGILDIHEDSTFNPDVFKVDLANACMTLSLCSFKGMGKYKTFYRLKTKFGKLGGDFAFSSPTGGNPRPFKKPVLMMEPGSVFLNSSRIDAGELIDNIHSDERIRHCGLPVTLELKIMEDG